MDIQLFIVLLIILIIFYLFNKYNKYNTYELFNSSFTKGPNIIQTWKTYELPEKYKPLVYKVKYLNPYSNYLFFDDNDIDKFINKQFPQYYDIFHQFSYTIQKIDFFRYLAVYYFGGVYLDLDILLFQSLKNIDKNNKCVFPLEFSKSSDKILHKQGLYGLIGNYAFYCPKGHPFMKLIIHNVVNNRIYKQNDKDSIPKMKYVYYTTGPVLVSQSYINYNKKDEINIIQPIPFKKSHFGNYGKHVTFGTWK